MRKNLRIFLMMIGASFSNLVFADGVPKTPELAHLIFPDRVITLDFRVQPEFLEVVPRHFFAIREKKIPLDFDGTLPKKNPIFDVKTEFEIAISMNRLRNFFESSAILREGSGSPVEIRLGERGEVVFEGVPRDGFRIDFEKLESLLNNAIRKRESWVRVPAEKVFSKVVVHPELKSRGISEVVAIGESNFAGSSAARRQNIVAAAKKYNGVIIPRGRRFSFNRILKSVDEESGFVRELVIKGNETKKELGGGVCQVSTTVFRAAFSGGFPIVARRNHSYAVPYYKPFGIDAAIYLGALDFRFLNDTPGDILIQTFVEKDNLFFVFYGTRDGRKVELQGPFISEYKPAPEAIVFETEDLPPGEISPISEGHDGFRSEWIRRVERADGTVDRESLISNYRPWPARVLRGKVALGR